MKTPTMRRLPGFWLLLALAVLITNRCAMGFTTWSQLHQSVSIILFEDELYEDVLSERVKLDNNDNLPPYVKDKVQNLDNVDPLVTLLALASIHPHYSGDNLNLSVTIIGKSITCLTHKRVALHLALMIRLIENAESQADFQIRSSVFLHAILYSMDLLFSINRNYDKLLSVYDLVFDMMSSPATAEVIDYNSYINALKIELLSLNDVIKSYCVVNEMKHYCKDLSLEEFGSCAEMITEDNLISNEMNADITVKSLKENENAIMNLFEEMDLFRGMSMSVWKFWLKTPELPINNPNQFTRTPLYKYADEVEEIIEFSTNKETQPDDQPAVEVPAEEVIPSTKIIEIA